MRAWHYEFRGGAYDGYALDALEDPEPVMVLWKHAPPCEGHATFDPHCPAILLRTAESYRRAEVDEAEMRVVYEVGDSTPGLDREERELVGAGLGDGLPVAHWRCRSLAVPLGAAWRN